MSARPRLEAAQLLTGIHPGVHSHTWHELVLILEGTYRVEVEGVAYTGGPGASFCYAAGRVHRPTGEGGLRLLLVWWRDDPDIARRPLCGEDGDGRLAAACHWLWEWAHHPGPPPPVVDSLLQVVLHLHGQDRSQLAGGVVARARAYLEQNLAHSPRLADLSRAVGMGPAQLNRRFRSELGIAPMQLLRRLRLERAVALLRDGSLSVAEIARSVGYRSPSHLSDQLVRHTGRRPGHYRRSG